MMVVELFLPIAVFAMIVVVIGLITRLIGTAIHHNTIRAAMKDDAASVPLLVERLEARQPWADALLGWIFLGFALALLLLGFTEAEASTRIETMRAAIVPAVVGIVVLLYVRIARARLPKD